MNRNEKPRSASVAAGIVALLTLAASANAETLNLSLKDAVQMALKGNTSAELARSSEERAKTAITQARSALLPTAEAKFLRINQSINLETFGFTLPGFPIIIGPFNVTDAQIGAAVDLFDLAALRRYQAAKEGLPAARFVREQADNEVIAAVARLYLLLQKTDAQVASSQANVKLFEDLARSADDQFKAGTATRLDTAVANVQLDREKQTLLVTQSQREAARLALLHAIGADQSSEVVPSDPTPPPSSVPAVDAALSTARQARPELKAAEARRRQAQMAVEAARMERLPTVGVEFLGDFSGIHSNDLLWSRRIAAGATLPLFEGGRITASIADAKEREHEAEIGLKEADRSVEEEVRRGVINLRNANERVTVAIENAKVADEELSVARDRLDNGVGSTIELDRAEDAVRQAHDDQISAASDAAEAGYELERATGTIRNLADGAAH